MVLFLFVVMLLNVPREDAAEWDRSHPLNRPARCGSARSSPVLLLLETVVGRLARQHPSADGALRDDHLGSVALGAPRSAARSSPTTPFRSKPPRC
jgi:hypothetical protein